MIDLRTDTITQPTAAMRRVIAEAVVEDEQKREDPTVIALEERSATLLGHEEAVFLPTATMANQIALRTLTEPGDEVIADGAAHIVLYELGGPAVHSGLVMKSLETDDGRFTTAQLREVVNPPADLHMAPTRLVCVENTHNGGGGRVWSVEQVRQVTAEAQSLALATHLDGARLLNAAVAAGVPAAEYGREFDTVSLCLSKGLGCPLGALIAGSRERMAKARRLKHLFGARCARRESWLRRASTLSTTTSSGSPTTMRTRRLAEGLVEAGMPVDLEQVETNFVQVDVGALGLGADDAVARLRAEGVLLSFATRKDVLRAVTHLDVSADDVEQAIERIPRALTGAPVADTAEAAPTPY